MTATQKGNVISLYLSVYLFQAYYLKIIAILLIMLKP
jgi:hypothetical protein